METNRIIDTYIPELAKISLFLLSSDICVYSRLQECCANMNIDIPIHSAKTLRASDKSMVSFVSRETSFYSCHKKKNK